LGALVTFSTKLGRGDVAIPMLGEVDPHSETHLGFVQMGPFIEEIDDLLRVARPGPEHNGLTRLRAVALSAAGSEANLSSSGIDRRRHAG
jgi:hypothetical protein